MPLYNTKLMMIILFIEINPIKSIDIRFYGFLVVKFDETIIKSLKRINKKNLLLDPYWFENTNYLYLTFRV